jgi:hypothetical protein
MHRVFFPLFKSKKDNTLTSTVDGVGGEKQKERCAGVGAAGRLEGRLPLGQCLVRLSYVYLVWRALSFFFILALSTAKQTKKDNI